MTFIQPTPSSKTGTIMKTLGIVVAVLVLLAVVAAGAFFIYIKSTEPLTPEEEFRAALQAVGGTYADLKDEIEAGDMNAIRAELEAKIAASNNPTERGILLSTLAQVVMSNSLSEGVALYKTIAADESLPLHIRASAYLSLALLHYTNTGDQVELATLVFTDEAPYKDMRPTDSSVAASEAAYAALLTEADSLQQTAIGNAYLARYFAEKAFENPEDAEASGNAQARAERAQYFIDGTPETGYDSSLATSKIVLGTAKLYIFGSSLQDPEDIVATIGEGFTEFSEVSALLSEGAADFQGSNTEAQESTRAGFTYTAHILWEGVLKAAASISTKRPDISAQVADLYGEYLLSEEGTEERVRAKSAESSIASYIQTLRTQSEQLQIALQ